MNTVIEYIGMFFRDLLTITNEMSPYLMLGFLFAGILHVFFPQDKITKYMGKSNFSSVMNAALLGVPLPLCSCGVIPTGISLYRNGASKGSAVSFLISTPQTGVDSIFVTYSLLGLPFAIIRPLIAFVTGIAGGLISNKVDAKSEVNISAYSGNVETDNVKGSKFKRMFTYAYVEFLQDLSKWLIIGLLLAALISVVIPDNFFTLYINNDYLSMLIVLAAAVPLYVCATASVPIAAVLMMKGLSPGAALVFLMAGPATNAATITVLSRVFGKKTLFSYLLTIIVGALFFGIIINEFLPREWFMINHSAMNHGGEHNHEEMIPLWFQYAMSTLLVGLIINGFVQKFYISPKNNINTNQTQNFQTVETITLKVKGMECNHCKMNVEKNVKTIDGIQNVSADIVKEQITLTGDNISLEKVAEMVNSLGYKFEGKVD